MVRTVPAFWKPADLIDKHASVNGGGSRSDCITGSSVEASKGAKHCSHGEHATVRVDLTHEDDRSDRDPVRAGVVSRIW